MNQWAAANCAAPPTVSAGQYTTLNCKPLLSVCGLCCRQTVVLLLKTSRRVKSQDHC